MFNISGFLEKFKILSQTNCFVKTTVIEAVTCVTGVCLCEKEITVSGDKVKIRQSSALKNEIFFKKEKILKKLSELGNDITKNIE